MDSSNEIDVFESTKSSEELTSFTTIPNLSDFPVSIFSKIDFRRKKDQLLVQIGLNGIDLSDIKIIAAEKTLILRIHRENESNFIRVISLPTPVNFEKGKADFSNDILTIGFPILPASHEIEIQES